MTILIAFQQSNYRTFKHFYLKHVCVYYRGEFPNLVSYSRFVGLKRDVFLLLTLYLSTRRGTCSGVSFIDSTRVRVCDNRRISSHLLIESVIRELKTQTQLEHSRHRSVENFQVNVVSALIAYQSHTFPNKTFHHKPSEKNGGK